MHTTRAWELVNDPNYCSKLNMVDLYNLMLRAGYSEEVAQEASNQRGNDRLDANVEM